MRCLKYSYAGNPVWSKNGAFLFFLWCSRFELLKVTERKMPKLSTRKLPNVSGVKNSYHIRRISRNVGQDMAVPAVNLRGREDLSVSILAFQHHVHTGLTCELSVEASESLELNAKPYFSVICILNHIVRPWVLILSLGIVWFRSVQEYARQRLELAWWTIGVTSMQWRISGMKNWRI